MGDFWDWLMRCKPWIVRVSVAVPCLVGGLVVASGGGGAAVAASSGLTLESVTVDYPQSHWSPTWTYSSPDPGGMAKWDTSTYTGTYSFPIPQTIPADGVTITLKVTAFTKQSAPHNTSFVPAEGINSSLVPGGYVAVNTTACGNCDPGYQTANPTTGTKDVTLTPNGSSPVTLSVGLQDGPTFTYTYEASSQSCPAASDTERAHAARTVPDLSGVWLTSDHSSRWTLFSSADRTRLTAQWQGAPDPQGLSSGSFVGQLNAAHSGYDGSIGEPPCQIGPMSMNMDSTSEQFGYPDLHVHYSETVRGHYGSFTIYMWLLPMRVHPGKKPAIEDEVGCPARGYCEGMDVGEPLGSTSSPDVAATARHIKVYGSARFRIPPGKQRSVRFTLNKAALKLLSKRGSLRVKVAIIMNKATGLPHATTVGIVTLHKK